MTALVEHEAGRAGALGPPLVSFESVTKRFGDVAANAEVSFAVRAGKVTALVGENGAGKSTAMNILAGLYLPDAGHVRLDGAIVEPGSPRAAVAAGIGMVHQQFKLVESLTGFENISLAADRGAFVQPRRAGPEVTRLAEELGFDLDLGRRVWQMPLAARQQLEILRVVALGARVLVLDEPTSVLSAPEAERMFEIVRRVRASGRAVILISHKLEEVMGIADEIVVMRSGRVVHAGPAGAVDITTLAGLIVGERRVAEARRPDAPAGPPVLTLRDLVVDDDLGVTAVDGVSFEVRAGELVAVLGVAGNGQSELLDAIGGLRRPRSGEIGAPTSGKRRTFGFIPAQHLGTAIAPGLSVAENTLIGHQHHAPFGPVLSPRLRATWAGRISARFSVLGKLGDPARTLSGGNLQRLALGRELAHAGPLVVASYPTRGLDVASAAAVRGALADAAAHGKGVVMASEEIEESLEIATRVLVMHRGRIVADRAPDGLGAGELGRLMTVGAG